MSSQVNRMITVLVTGLTALAVGGAPPAQATPRSGLPPIGAEIPMSMLALHVPIARKGEMFDPISAAG